jgi:hypothetical protein
MTDDKEIAAISSVSRALEGLEEDARLRVLEWAMRRFGASQGAGLMPALGMQGAPTVGAGSGSPQEDGPAFEDFVDLFDATSPQTDAERALVGGYWFQVELGNPDFQSQEVNTALKDLGRGVGNITDALGALQGRKPVLVRQVAKSGRTKQARKKYKLTAAGISAVKGMLKGEASEEQP